MSQTGIIFACVRCLQTPILMFVQGDLGMPESFTNKITFYGKVEKFY